MGRQAPAADLTTGATPLQNLINAFLLGFPALFSVVNPLNGGMAFRSLTRHRSEMARERLAQLVALYSLGVMLVAVWAGAFVLNFFGVTLSALRVAGGLIIAIYAWRLLTEPDIPSIDDPTPAQVHAESDDIAVVPLTIPLTAGPGTISVTIAIASEHPAGGFGEVWFFIGLSLACLAMAVVVWASYRSADRIIRTLGPTGGRTLTRLIGFLLLCIGAQIMIVGITDVLEPLLARR